MRIRGISLALVCVLAPFAADAHPGGLDAAGCHNNRKTGNYHCHRGSGGRGPAPSSRPQRALAGETYYPDCAVARAAGAAALRRGDPGYRAGLDRDNYGRACEYSR
ncbi:YHYH domain-containing protein [Novosphingobium sp. P6W]|uniref:YHYH domain-containing protein n=1 Tax=Novosphingobium sp. P6W TaxID=1609758 RepID=UPI0009E5E7D9|nr:YHYH domain-containing protein [Novosphingobium sp. P6W]AXB75504.1 YHYH domain-containing protein [Novosphingobium sp. P6W]